MKSSSLAFAVALLMAGQLIAQSQNQTKKDEAGTDIARVLLDLTRQEDEAETKMDEAALNRLLSDDFFLTIPNGKKITKADYLKAGREGHVAEPEMTVKGITYEDFKAQRYGDAAVANYLATFTYLDKAGKEQPRRFRNTVLWVMQKGSWRAATWCSVPF